MTSTDALGDSGSPGAEADSRTLVGYVAAIDRAGEALIRNPNEPLLMEALMSRLSGLAS